MNNRRFISIIFCIGICIAMVCCVVVYHMTTLVDTKIVFLDVGQGDAILITQGTNQILIDGGPDSIVLLEELSQYMPFWDRTIEIVVATHPDSDHIDGLIGVLRNYHVKQVWHTDAAKDTATYKMLMHEMEKDGDVESVCAFHGLTALLDGASVDVIAPFDDDIDYVEDVNDASIVILFTVADEIFYFGGDATSAIEDLLTVDQVTVFKASHHGSQSSTSEKFLNIVHPRDVVISVGRDNRYGHPHEEVLERIWHAGAQIFRTDQEGSIVYKCDHKHCERIFE